MKGLILSGGTGSRLRPITHTGPKQLIPIANKPVLEYAIEDLRAAGITDIGIILGQIGRDEIQARIGDGSDYGVDITYLVQGRALGLAHAVGCARDFVEDESFVVYLGDNILKDGIAGLVHEFDAGVHDAGIGLQRVADPSRFGVADVTDDGRVTGLVEKPDDPPSDLALIGIYVFTPDVFEYIEGLRPSWRGEYEITDVLQSILDDDGQVQSQVVDGWWKDTGKPQDILDANRLVLDDLDTSVNGVIEDGADVRGRIHLDAGSVVEEGAAIRGPVSIGSNTVIETGAYVGPYTSIGDDSHVKSAHIESSVVIEETQIDCDVKIVDSLIGSNVTISDSEDAVPSGTRLVVGEHSTLSL